MKKNSSAKYTALRTDEQGLGGLAGQSGLVKSALTGPSNLSKKAEEGLSYESIFTYSAPSESGSSGFTEYWRPSECSVINEPRREDDSGVFESFIWLFLHPPFASTQTKSGNRSAIRDGSDDIKATTVAIARQIVWTVMFILFSFVWLVLFPFHWYWTLSRVRLNEAVVVFRVGQAPLVRKKPGSVICIWPLLDRLHRVTLSRRGFSVPPTQIGLNDGSVVRLGAEISFHITDPLRFVRMSNDTATSIRHVVHGQFVSHLASQSLENLQRFASGVQTEMRAICSNHLSQFGVFVDTFTLSPLEVIRQPIDPGQEFIKTILQAIGSPGSFNPLSSIISSAMPFASETVPPSATAADGLDNLPQQFDAGIDKAQALRITEFLTEAMHNLSSETRSSLNLDPDAMFRLTLGKHDSWLLFPYTGHVDGPIKPPQKGESGNIMGYKEKGSLYVADWETLESLRDGKMSPVAAAMSGYLHVSGDAAALASLFDPSKLQSV